VTSSSARARCRRFGHAWSGWGLWQAVQPQLKETSVERSGDKPVNVSFAQRRFRRCQRCFVVESQDGAGKIERAR
jgi:hypothetical protein